MMRKAKIVADGFYLTCPDCGEGLPEPDSGSFAWTLEDLKKHEGEFGCDECFGIFQLTVPKRVEVAA